MKVKVVNLKGVLFEGEAKAVNAQTESGEITLLDHHQPLISVLKKGGRLWVEGAGARQEFAAPGGFLHMNGNNELTVLVD